jgi:hypothetical protein
MTSRVRVTRRSLTLAAAIATLVGVPLLAGPTASAQEAGSVTFNGGCGVLGSGLGANSTPDATQVSVPAGSGVRFTNRLGQAATLRLDGEAAAEVPAGGTADVVFNDGPVAASMQISCLLGTPAGTVTVEVAEAEPAPADPGDDPADPAAGAGDQTDPPGQNGSNNGGSQDGEASGDPVWGGWNEGIAPPPAGVPDDAAGRPARVTRDRNADRPPRWGVEVEPPNGGASSGEPATVDQESGGNELAADQLARTSGSTPDDGPIGLLALIATVCVVGVSAGAVRALISQRAHRAEWA